MSSDIMSELLVRSERASKEKEPKLSRINRDIKPPLDFWVDGCKASPDLAKILDKQINCLKNTNSVKPLCLFHCYAAARNEEKDKISYDIRIGNVLESDKIVQRAMKDIDSFIKELDEHYIGCSDDVKILYVIKRMKRIRKKLLK